MKNAILALLLAVVIGGTAALYRPATPYQVPAEVNQAVFVPRGGSSDFFDSGLDNDEIEADGNITPSRKCGFCMG